MKCEQLREQLDAIALTPPTEIEDPAILEHLKACESCRQELRERQEAWLAVSAELHTNPTSAALESKLFDRVAQSPNPVRVPEEYSRTAVVLRYVMAASVLFLLSSLTLFRLGQFGSNRPDETMMSIRSIAEQMEKLESLERVFASPTLKYVSLETNSKESPSGYLVHDPMSGQFHFFGQNLDGKSLDAQESHLHVWLLDVEGVVLASSRIELDSDLNLGAALLTQKRPDKVAALVVTREERIGAVTPSDAVVFHSVLSDF